jgi:preprotein translocase subunit SecA
MYEHLCGMTGTAQTSAEEFLSVYKLEVVAIPTNNPNIRIDLTDQIYRTEEGKYQSIIKEIKERNSTGQPILVGTRSVEINEKISKLLSLEGVKHNVLNAKQHEREGEIIAQAGRLNAVTVATNMAGRGVDIILGGNPSIKEEREKILGLGGLFVLGTERHEARRIDNQLRGRTGRQGDVGTTQFFVSLEDEMIKIFAPKTIGTIMEKFGFKEDEAISHPMITKSIESAQTKIEGINFDMRKHVLEYDDVLNQQRKAVYNKRQILVLENDEQKIQELVFGLIEEKLKTDIKNLELKLENVKEYLTSINISLDEDIIKANLKNSDKLFFAILENIRQIYFQKEKDIQNFNQITRSVALSILDSL